MTASLTVACLWALVATLIAMAPRRWHWPAAYALALVGIPLLGWITYENGPFWGMLALAGGASVLRWPLIFLLRRMRGQGAD
ncbi:DUF2484 family protein [Gemmobacter fulvus]|uniref:DUF2484 family protein n=1 Tax=Gemmobacter fulvus TaxID=2840474 RepID=A0A975P7I2_9RHOB|nr:DUF2484 family protein [Gemmobacter fulvus]MBT9247063.1 DUF2484 family protein [Gemmobacter fulvus]MDQ1847483.1 DUF2484 family protein [Gemmobacter fulvus]QWK89831.1 DUF2484 family protein [Gemmobacter fulvus]